MAKDHSIVRELKDGIEFFTKKETGESGMSISGLALCCGVSRTAITSRFTATKSDWKLETVRVISETSGKSTTVSIVKDTVCAETIAYYASQGKSKALSSLVGFAAIGIRHFIHQKTGWTPAQQSVHLVLSDIVSRDPLPWEHHFSKEWAQNAERLTGWKWEYRVMGKFIGSK